MIDLDKNCTFIGINWIYLMNIKSKLNEYKHPNFLIYYKLEGEGFSVVGI
jgi:hypothetical protein